MQAQPDSGDDAASSSGEEEDAEAKTARTGRPAAAGRSSSAAIRKQLQPAQATGKKAADLASKKRKRSRSRGETDNEGDEVGHGRNSLVMTDGPVTVEAQGTDTVVQNIDASKLPRGTAQIPNPGMNHAKFLVRLNIQPPHDDLLLEVIQLSFSCLICHIVDKASGPCCFAWQMSFCQMSS